MFHCVTSVSAHTPPFITVVASAWLIVAFQYFNMCECSIHERLGPKRRSVTHGSRSLLYDQSSLALIFGLSKVHWNPEHDENVLSSSSVSKFVKIHLVSAVLTLSWTVSTSSNKMSSRLLTMLPRLTGRSGCHGDRR